MEGSTSCTSDNDVNTSHETETVWFFYQLLTLNIFDSFDFQNITFFEMTFYMADLLPVHI